MVEEETRDFKTIRVRPAKAWGRLQRNIGGWSSDNPRFSERASGLVAQIDEAVKEKGDIEELGRKTGRMLQEVAGENPESAKALVNLIIDEEMRKAPLSLRDRLKRNYIAEDYRNKVIDFTGAYAGSISKECPLFEDEYIRRQKRTLVSGEEGISPDRVGLVKEERAGDIQRLLERGLFEGDGDAVLKKLLREDSAFRWALIESYEEGSVQGKYPEIAEEEAKGLWSMTTQFYQFNTNSPGSSYVSGIEGTGGVEYRRDRAYHEARDGFSDLALTTEHAYVYALASENLYRLKKNKEIVEAQYPQLREREPDYLRGLVEHAIGLDPNFTPDNFYRPVTPQYKMEEIE